MTSLTGLEVQTFLLPFFHDSSRIMCMQSSIKHLKPYIQSTFGTLVSSLHDLIRAHAVVLQVLSLRGNYLRVFPVGPCLGKLVRLDVTNNAQLRIPGAILHAVELLCPAFGGIMVNRPDPTDGELQVTFLAFSAAQCAQISHHVRRVSAPDYSLEFLADIGRFAEASLVHVYIEVRNAGMLMSKSCEGLGATQGRCRVKACECGR